MGRVDQVAQQAANNKSGGYNKGVLDCRAVNSLATIPTDKSHFRNWEDRLINAYIQYAGVQARALFKLIIDCTEVNSNDEPDSILWDPIADTEDKLQYEKFSEDLYYVLVEKCQDSTSITRIVGFTRRRH